MYPNKYIRKQSQWRRKYLRILEHGPYPDAVLNRNEELLKEERMLLADLADEGFIKGKSEGGFEYAGSTIKGMVFADKLKRDLDSEGLRGWSRRLLWWIIGLATYYIQHKLTGG